MKETMERKKRTTCCRELIIHSSGNVAVPLTAVAVKVTSMINPYLITICELNNYSERLHVITKKLSSLVLKKKLDSGVDNKQAKIGDTVVIPSGQEWNLESPSWCHRGIITDFDSDINKYNIFFTDYGITMSMKKETFIVVPKNLIPDEYLTSVIGIYNILPLAAGEKFLISESWSKPAIQFAKTLIAASDTVYFDCLAYSKSGETFGDLYLNVDNEILSLSQALIRKFYAVPLKDDLLKLIKNPVDFPKENIESNMCFLVKASQNSQSPTKDSEIKPYQKNIVINERQKVLVSSDVKCKILHSIQDARFPIGIHKAWEMMLRSSRPKRIQSYILPAIRKRLNVVAIGTADSGKTVGYTMAITALLAMQENLPRGNKPSVLILCSSSANVLNVNSLCREFLQNYNIGCVAAFSGKPERTLVAEIYNGCQVLVSTPGFLARFLRENKAFLNFNYLRYLVLDDASVILDKYFYTVKELFRIHHILKNRESLDDNTLQIIVAARNWTPLLKRFVFYFMDNPYICIASFLEAIVFKSVRPKIYITKNKDATTLDVLQKESTTLKTMIVCATIEEAEGLNEILRNTFWTILVHENLNMLNLEDIKQRWKSCSFVVYPILICTDDVLSDLDITDIEWLIHYSVSLESKTKFNYRFSTLFNNLSERETNCKVTVMIDDSNDLQFVSIIRIMERIGAVIPPKICNSIKHITTTLDRRKKKYAICDNVKAFGSCPNEESCTFRHCVLPEVDEPLVDIKINDKVKLMLQYIHDATHLSARVLGYIRAETKECIEFPSEDQIKLSMKMQKYYTNVENRRRCVTVDVGDVCAMEVSLDTFRRVQILCITRKEINAFERILVDVRCIDTGHIHYKINAHKLLQIPKELLDLPIRTFEIFLVGLAPHDNEDTWNNCANDAVHNWFAESYDENSYVIGTVHLHLGNTIWVDTLEIGTKLTGRPDLIGLSLKEELIKKNHAVTTKDHSSKLHELCRNSGIPKINGFDVDAVQSI